MAATAVLQDEQECWQLFEPFSCPFFMQALDLLYAMSQPGAFPRDDTESEGSWLAALQCALPLLHGDNRAAFVSAMAAHLGQVGWDPVQVVELTKVLLGQEDVSVGGTRRGMFAEQDVSLPTQASRTQT
jgi:hypothetical protein